MDARKLAHACVLALTVCALSAARAQAPKANLELSFTPTDRVQLAVWIERDDGVFMGTFALTHAVAVTGIGNRPGALQMNSGFRWPYGRREGVLPVWAHRRAAAPDARPFRRVIFQNRSSEGFASRTSNDQSRDDYYCLSFNRDSTGLDALDAVTCASVFSSDKGRFLSESDVGYSEPYEDERGASSKRALSLNSLYPPRRDVGRCTSQGCYDHQDVAAFGQHAREVMPELDAISQATPEGERRVNWTFPIPSNWSGEHDYILYLEVNVEGDYNGRWNVERFPTPSEPSDGWDSWAKTYGYPYRGQPSVVYALPFSLDSASTITTRTPVGYGSVEGQDGELRPIDDSISDDPNAAPGSGADRLRDISGVRASLRVLNADPCTRPDAPATCGMSCSGASEVCGSLFCDPRSNTCQSYCAATVAPAAVQELRVSAYPDEQRAHMWAKLWFRAANSERPIGGYEVKVRAAGGDWMSAFTHDTVQELLPVALDVCNDPVDPMRNRCLEMQAGTPIEVDLAGLKQSTRYTISVTARDAMCSALGEAAMTEFVTPERTFSTVSPCFIASVAYGSPLASEVSVLRRVRDRYLASHGPGRVLVDAYYELGPALAEFVAPHPWLRSVSRAVLAPFVALSRWWDA